MLRLREAIERRKKIFEDAAARSSTDKIGLQILRERNRFLCRNDLYYLGQVCGFTEWEPGKVAGFVRRFHRDFCDSVSLLNWKLISLGMFPPSQDMVKLSEIADDIKDLGKNRRMYEKFRSAYKSTIVTKLGAIQLLLNFPEIHIAVVHNTQENASDLLISIKRLFLTTGLSKLFPEYIPNSKDWGNTLGFSAACRKDWKMTGDNIEAFGIGTEVTGRKFHVFKIDDFVTEKSVTNEEQLRQSIQYVESHKSLFLNPSLVVEDYSVTKYHFADATTYLENDPDVECHIQAVLKPNPEGTIDWEGKKWECTLPEHFTIEGLGKAGVSGLMKDEAQFNLQYMLNPHNPKKIKFTKDMIQTFTSIPEGLNYYLLVDPADSDEKRACYTAMKVMGVDSDENWYWVDGVFDKLDDHERIESAIELAQKWKVFEVLWENLSFGRTDNRNLERRRREIKDATWQVVPVGASKISKDDRILGLNDRYSRRKIFWAPRMNYYSKFEGKVIDIVKAQEYEFLSFPMCSHKDLLDAESFMLQVDVIKGDGVKPKDVSKWAHIKDKNQRGATEVFWKDFDEWKDNDFKSANEAMDFTDNY